MHGSVGELKATLNAEDLEEKARMKRVYYEYNLPVPHFEVPAKNYRNKRSFKDSTNIEPEGDTKHERYKKQYVVGPIVHYSHGGGGAGLGAGAGAIPRDIPSGYFVPQRSSLVQRLLNALQARQGSARRPYGKLVTAGPIFVVGYGGAGAGAGAGVSYGLYGRKKREARARKGCSPCVGPQLFKASPNWLCFVPAKCTTLGEKPTLKVLGKTPDTKIVREDEEKNYPEVAGKEGLGAKIDRPAAKIEGLAEKTERPEAGIGGLGAEINLPATSVERRGVGSSGSRRKEKTFPEFEIVVESAIKTVDLLGQAILEILFGIPDNGTEPIPKVETDNRVGGTTGLIPTAGDVKLTEAEAGEEISSEEDEAPGDGISSKEVERTGEGIWFQVQEFLDSVGFSSPEKPAVAVNTDHKTNDVKEDEKTESQATENEQTLQEISNETVQEDMSAEKFPEIAVV